MHKVGLLEVGKFLDRQGNWVQSDWMLTNRKSESKGFSWSVTQTANLNAGYREINAWSRGIYIATAPPHWSLTSMYSIIWEVSRATHNRHLIHRILHQTPISSAFLSDCSAMPQILFRFIIDGLSTHFRRYVHPIRLHLLPLKCSSGKWTWYQGALSLIHACTMWSLSERKLRCLDRMWRDVEKRHSRAERVQRDAISINISKGSCSIFDRAWRHRGGSRRIGIVKW